MRLLLTAVGVVLLAGTSGCSLLARGEPDAGRLYDPSKIYLDMEPVMIPEGMDRDRYACRTGPVICESSAIRWQCRCRR